MEIFTIIITDFVYVDVKIDEEGKVVIVLNSLPDEEYETFTLTLINGRQTFNYSKATDALVNYVIRRPDRISSSKNILPEALAEKGKSFNQKGRGDQERSMSRPRFRDL